MDKDSLGDQPIEHRYFAIMKVLASAIDSVLNGEAVGTARKTGFVLMVYPFNDEGGTDGRCNYISNGADRQDVVLLMKEMIKRFEGQPEMTGSA